MDPIIYKYDFISVCILLLSTYFILKIRTENAQNVRFYESTVRQEIYSVIQVKFYVRLQIFWYVVLFFKVPQGTSNNIIISE